LRPFAAIFLLSCLAYKSPPKAVAKA